MKFFTDLFALSCLQRRVLSSLILNFSDDRIFDLLGVFNLYTFIINNYQDFQELTYLARKQKLYESIVFLIFKESVESHTLEICNHPKENYMNLRFDSQVFVQCSKNSIIKEWYSINGTEIRIVDFAKWNYNNKLERISNLTLFKRRNNLNGAVLRVMVRIINFSHMSYKLLIVTVV